MCSRRRGTLLAVEGGSQRSPQVGPREDCPQTLFLLCRWRRSRRTEVSPVTEREVVPQKARARDTESERAKTQESRNLACDVSKSTHDTVEIDHFVAQKVHSRTINSQCGEEPFPSCRPSRSRRWPRRVRPPSCQLPLRFADRRLNAPGRAPLFENSRRRGVWIEELPRLELRGTTGSPSTVSSMTRSRKPAPRSRGCSRRVNVNLEANTILCLREGRSLNASQLPGCLLWRFSRELCDGRLPSAMDDDAC